MGRSERVAPCAAFCCTQSWLWMRVPAACSASSMPRRGIAREARSSLDAVRKTPQKESQRWLDGTSRAGEVLAAANSITGVSDRESDIYEHFARRPSNVHLIVRACQNRQIETDREDPISLLFPHVDSLPEQGRLKVKIPAAPGRKARVAELAVRFSRVVLCKPLHGAAPDLPATIALTMVDVRETSKPEDGKPIHWRLLTTHEVTNLGEARRIIDLYRMRWIIEEFFHTLKTAGFNIEAADIGDPQVMIKFVTAATVAAVTVMQIVKARDGTTGQSLTDAFDPADQPILEAVSAQLEGKTARKRTRTLEARLPSRPGSSLVSAAGQAITASQARKSCAGVSTTSSASSTGLLWRFNMCESDSPLWGGVGGGGRSEDATKCPQRERAANLGYARSYDRDAATPPGARRCGRPRQKPNANSGGTCAIVSLRRVRTFVAKFESAVTSPTLPVTRHASSSRSMAASTAQHQQPTKRARSPRSATAIGSCATGTTTC